MANSINQPMYQRIKEDILHQIESRLLLPGDRLPTEQQLMEQYNVSRITVSKALGELKRDRKIERFPNKGTFVAQSQPLSPLVADFTSSQKDDSYTDLLPEIACIIPTIADMFSLSMTNGVLSAFPGDKYVCHFFQSKTPQMENYLLKHCLETNIAGIVLFPQDQPFFSNELLLMNLRKYPLVLLDRNLPHLNTSYVISDNNMAGELCIRHLHELGHQRIAFITSSEQNVFSIRHRLDGMLATAEKLNMTKDSIHVIPHLNINNELSYYQESLNKLITENKVTALVAAEGNTCTYLYNLCASLKLRIPGDISLISFDRPMTEVRNPDFFTHIDQSEFVMGSEAGTLLRQRIEQHDTTPYHRVITPSLVIGQSTTNAVF